MPKNLRIATQDTIIRPNTGPSAEKTEIGSAQPNLPDIPVKKGEGVIWSDYAMARMPEIWGPDCQEYKPERFLEPKSDGSGEMQVVQFGSYKFHAFNAGPRVCLGQTLATFEGMAAIAGILQKYVIQETIAIRHTQGDMLTLCDNVPDFATALMSFMTMRRCVETLPYMPTASPTL